MTTVDASPAPPPSLVEAFRRDGFVVVPDLLSVDELRRYGSAVDEAVERRSRFDSPRAGGEVPL